MKNFHLLPTEESICDEDFSLKIIIFSRVARKRTFVTEGFLPSHNQRKEVRSDKFSWDLHSDSDPIPIKPFKTRLEI
ncbi:hypothetical protein LEP1GSC058_1347 [Leptospira fainei serovar Hurstbridge str. BUT 6]|uniref:Uncharacterized protein n=1 Tax=Leptospira fainei serovar Hurstbridge str. BUT 6 TaxID=1193011 RepID=S3V6G7_9LEPT|nr:hypothetical protein LEP1GSC058_1347 [Leptospira fainei serovar Hurstbridge str. BUT 6]